MVSAARPHLPLPAETLDGLLRSFSHDARNPLLVLEGSLDLAQHRGAEDLPALLDRLRWVHADLCARLDLFTESARVVLARPGLRRSRVRLGPLLSELARQLGPLFEMARVPLEFPQDTPLAVLTDAALLSRILANLGLRALRHAAAGRPWRIRVEERPGAIRLEIEQPPLEGIEVAALLARRELDLAAVVVLADDLGIAFAAGAASITLDVPTEAYD